MDLIVLHNREARTVSVEREGDGWLVRVDDRSYRVDAASAGPNLSSLVIDGVQHEVAVHRSPGDRYTVTAGPLSETLDVTDPLTHLARESRGGSGSGGRDRVTALMPGRVVAVLAEAGSEVTEGQGVVVLEAMKMENEIQAERDGTLKQLFVEPGQAVEGGDPLFEIE